MCTSNDQKHHCQVEKINHLELLEFYEVYICKVKYYKPIYKCTYYKSSKYLELLYIDINFNLQEFHLIQVLPSLAVGTSLGTNHI